MIDFWIFKIYIFCSSYPFSLIFLPHQRFLFFAQKYPKSGKMTFYLFYHIHCIYCSHIKHLCYTQYNKTNDYAKHLFWKKSTVFIYLLFAAVVCFQCILHKNFNKIYKKEYSRELVPWNVLSYFERCHQHHQLLKVFLENFVVKMPKPDFDMWIKFWIFSYFWKKKHFNFWNSSAELEKIPLRVYIISYFQVQHIHGWCSSTVYKCTV